MSMYYVYVYSFSEFSSATAGADQTGKFHNHLRQAAGTEANRHSGVCRIERSAVEGPTRGGVQEIAEQSQHRAAEDHAALQHRQPAHSG